MTGTCALTVFVGPSLRPGDHDDLRRRADAAAVDGLTVTILPAVRRGDLTAAVERGAPGDVVLILDGEFGQQLSVSVVEIRDALAAGRQVLGASSMGALRAAECAELGMLGFGSVFDDYRHDRLHSDVEVALIFDPETYQPVTVPLVNVRWVAGLLLADDVLSTAQRDDVVDWAGQLPFRARTIEAMDALWAASPHLDLSARARLSAMLAPDTGAPFDRKRLDALEALDIAELLAQQTRERALDPAWFAA